MMPATEIRDRIHIIFLHHLGQTDMLGSMDAWYLGGSVRKSA